MAVVGDFIFQASFRPCILWSFRARVVGSRAVVRLPAALPIVLREPPKCRLTLRCCFIRENLRSKINCQVRSKRQTRLLRRLDRLRWLAQRRCVGCVKASSAGFSVEPNALLVCWAAANFEGGTRWPISGQFPVSRPVVVRRILAAASNFAASDRRLSVSRRAVVSAPLLIRVFRRFARRQVSSFPPRLL